MHRLESARHPGRSQRLPNCYRLGPSFQRERAEVAVIEVSPCEAARLRADQHRPWFRQRLQARGEIRRLADDRLFRRGFTDQQLAYNHGACRNADASLQRGIDTCPEIRDGIDEHKRGSHCLFGIILLRARIAEIGEHAFVHVPSDHAMVAADDFTDAGVIGRDHAPHVFRVQLRRERIRADQFAKHYRQVASLGFIPRRRFGRSFGRFKSGPVKLRDGAQHLAAMSKRNAEFR